MATVAQVGSVRLGRQRSPEKQTGRFATKYLRAANITANGLNLRNLLEMDFTPAERQLFGLRQGDLVLAEGSGSADQVGRAALWRGEVPGCCYQNTVIRFRPHAAVAEYALVLFRYYAASGVFARAARGVGILHLGASRFAELPFPLPPSAEQRRIAAAVEERLRELSEAEISLRSAIRRIGEQNREILAAAVAGELVEPEAILADREERQFEHGATLLARTLATGEQGSLFDHQEPGPTDEPRLETRRLPPGWAWARVDQVGDVTLGKKREPKSHRGPYMRPYLRVANVFEDRIDTSDVLEMNFSPEEYESYALRPGDILLNEGQSPELVGRPALYRGEVPGACFQMTLLRFRAGPAVDPEYALIVFRYYLHAGEFRKAARWSTNIAHLSRQRLVAMPFPLPPLAEQRRIAAEVRRRLDASAAQEAAVRASLDRLPTLEAELLAAAVSGSLLPQDASDEPASALLERLGPPPIEAPAIGSRDPIFEGGRDTMSGRRPDDGALPTSDLAQVLRMAGHPLRLPELFSRAGYDRDSTEHIEQFYLALRAELGRSIRPVGSTGENALLEVVADAAR